jgi:hypothetical protein
MEENWLPVVGFEQFYEVSDQGRVRSLRYGKVLKSSGRYPMLILTMGGVPAGRYVHRLVLEAFVGPCPDGCECRHLDGNSRNNALSNLAWGTSGENKLDEVRHGTHPEASRAHCEAGHEFNEMNSYWNGRQRVCRPCRARRLRDWNERNAQSGRQCSVDNCGKPPVARGLCRTHYTQQWRKDRAEHVDLP